MPVIWLYLKSVTFPFKYYVNSVILKKNYIPCLLKKKISFTMAWNPYFKSTGIMLMDGQFYFLSTNLESLWTMRE